MKINLIVLVIFLVGCGGGGGTVAPPFQPIEETGKPVVVFPLSNEPIVILATGQSNMVGQGVGGSFKINQQVKIWHNIAREFQILDLKNNEYPMTLGAPDSIGGGRNNAAAAFALRIQEETSRPVFLIIDAMSGESISQWSDGSFSQTLSATVNEAGIDRIDFFLWLQGERDHSVDMSYQVYQAAFQRMINTLEVGMEIVNIITAPLNEDFLIAYPRSSGVNGFLNSLLSADVSGLDTFDQVHYTGAALFELGYNRLWDAINAN